MNDADYLAVLAAEQTATIAHHVLPDGRSVWLRKAGRRNPAWRYALLGAAVKVLRLGVLAPVPNVGGHAGIATEAARLQALAAAGVYVPRLLAVQENALLMSDLGGHTLLHGVGVEAEQGQLSFWQQGLEALAAVHRQGQYLSQAFARNMMVDEQGRIGFIDFEDDPATVLTLAQCQSRDYLCYLQSTAVLLRGQGLLPQAVVIWHEHLQTRPPDLRDSLMRTVRPIAWMQHLQHRRWGNDTLQLGAVAALFAAWDEQ